MTGGLFLSVALLAAAAVAPIAAQPAQLPQSQKPVTIQEPPLYVNAPEHLEALVRTSEVIVHGRIVASRPLFDGHRLVHTDQRVQVDQVLKSGSARSAVGDTLSFLQDAGEIDTFNAILRVDNQPLQVGSEYILFLERSGQDVGVRCVVRRPGCGGRRGCL